MGAGAPLLPGLPVILPGTAALSGRPSSTRYPHPASPKNDPRLKSARNENIASKGLNAGARLPYNNSPAVAEPQVKTGDEMPENLDQLRGSFRGELLQPGDTGYDQARKLYNGMIDKHPRLIARCVDAADVMAGVNHARNNRMLLAVRGGGHSGPGLGSCDDGMVIDLSRMKDVRACGSPGDDFWRKSPVAASGAISSTTATAPFRHGGSVRIHLDDRSWAVMLDSWRCRIGYLSRSCGLDNRQSPGR